MSSQWLSSLARNTLCTLDKTGRSRPVVWTKNHPKTRGSVDMHGMGGPLGHLGSYSLSLIAQNMLFSFVRGAKFHDKPTKMLNLWRTLNRSQQDFPLKKKEHEGTTLFFLKHLYTRWFFTPWMPSLSCNLDGSARWVEHWALWVLPDSQPQDMNSWIMTWGIKLARRNHYDYIIHETGMMRILADLAWSSSPMASFSSSPVLPRTSSSTNVSSCLAKSSPDHAATCWEKTNQVAIVSKPLPLKGSPIADSIGNTQRLLPIPASEWAYFCLALLQVASR